mgnify:CR=1 FL=1
MSRFGGASASDVPAESLSEKNWRAIQERFAPYAELLTRKPVMTRPPDDAKRVDFPGLPPLALAGEDDPLQRAFLPTAPEEALDKLSAAELDACSTARWSSPLPDMCGGIWPRRAWPRCATWKN